MNEHIKKKNFMEGVQNFQLKSKLQFSPGNTWYDFPPSKQHSSSVFTTIIQNQNTKPVGCGNKKKI